MTAQAPHPGAPTALQLDTQNDHTLRTTRSGLTRVAAQAFSFALSLVAGMLLARLLRPQDFGLFAMAQWLVALVTTFRDFGLPVATIHAQTLDQRQMSALFWLSVRLGLGVLVLLVVAAPALAWFYAEPRLTWVVMVCALGLFVGGLAAQHDALLARRMRFRAIASVEITSLGLSLVVALALAWAGTGIWALVGQFVAQHGVRTAGLWWACQWWPTLTLGNTVTRPSMDAATRAMVVFGLRATGARVVTFVGRNIDTVVVGALHGATALGFYQNAYRWSTLPVQQLYLPLMNVAVASLSRVRDMPQQYRQTALGLFLPLFGLAAPTLTYFVVDAERVVAFLLGDQWQPSVPLLRVLSVGAVVGLPMLVTKWLYLSIGDTRRQLRWSVIQSVVLLTGVIVGAWWGAFGVAVGFTVATALLTVPSVLACVRVTPLSARAIFGMMWQPWLASVLAVLPLLWLGPQPDKVLLPALALRGTVYMLGYAGAWCILPGGPTQLRAVLRLLRATFTQEQAQPVST